MAFLGVALLEAVLAFLQGTVTGLSYMVLCMSLVLAAANNTLDLPNSLMAFLPSQIFILAAPLLALPMASWHQRVNLTAQLLLPILTLLGSTVLWVFAALRSERRTVQRQLKRVLQAQDLLKAQVGALLSEKIKNKGSEEARQNTALSTTLAQTVSNPYALEELVKLVATGLENLRETSATLRFKREPAIEFQDAEVRQTTLPVLVAMDKADFAMVYASLLKRSLLSLNGESGLIRVSVRVGLQNVVVTIEDNGWGFREKFLQIKSAEKASAQASEVGISLLEAQALLKFWGGRLEVLSRLGVGSRVILELARVDAFASLRNDAFASQGKGQAQYGEAIEATQVST